MERTANTAASPASPARAGAASMQQAPPVAASDAPPAQATADASTAQQPPTASTRAPRPMDATAPPGSRAYYSTVNTRDTVVCCAPNKVCVVYDARPHCLPTGRKFVEMQPSPTASRRRDLGEAQARRGRGRARREGSDARGDDGAHFVCGRACAAASSSSGRVLLCWRLSTRARVTC